MMFFDHHQASIHDDKDDGDDDCDEDDCDDNDGDCDDDDWSDGTNVISSPLPVLCDKSHHQL